MRRLLLPFYTALVMSITMQVDAQPGNRTGVVFDRERFRIPATKHVLANGLTLLVHEDHSSPIVSVNVWYHVGSRNERRGRTGFAHLFEHFFFNGSEHHPGGFREAMDDLGANNRNGTTSGDRTNFYEDVPVSALERTLYLEADRMGFLEKNITQAMLERERGVVKNEKRQNENQPYGLVYGKIDAAMYPWSHPYSWQTIGSMEDLDAATLSDITEWYRTYYGPNNAVITLAGDITSARALELVRKYFASIPPGPPLERLEEWVPRLERNIRQTMEDRVPQARIFRVYHAPAWGDAALQHLELFANLLAGSKSSRLDRRLKYDRELVTSIGAWVSDAEIASTFSIVATVSPGVDPADVEREIDAVVAQLISAGPTPSELERVKSRILSGFVRRRESLLGRGRVLNESMTYGGNHDAYLDQLETIARASVADVKAAAKKWIGDEHHYTMVVTPLPALASGDVPIDRAMLPPLGDVPESRFPQLQRARLRNGLSVVLLERHATPLVNMSMVLHGGYASDLAGQEGTAALSLSMLDEGTTSRSAFAIEDELDAIGAEISTSNDLDVSIVRLSALSTAFDRALDIYADVVLRPAFREESLRIGRRTALAGIAQQRADPSSAAFRLLPSILYGADHPYGKPAGGAGYDSTVSTVTEATLRAWHTVVFQPNNATLVVVGDITMPVLMSALESEFGTWRSFEDPMTRRVAPIAARPSPNVYIVDRPGAKQTVIVAAHTTSTIGQPDDLALEVLMRNFGGIATSRLNRNLRLDKHWSYGTRGSVRNARGPRTFSIVAPVQSDKTIESMREIAMEIRGVAGERPTVGEEFASMMRNQTLRMPARFETLDDLERAAIDIVTYDLPDDYWSTYPSRVRTLTEADLARAASNHVHPDQIVWIVVGDAAVIETGVRSLGFGEVVRIEQVP